MIKVLEMTFNTVFQENTYILYDETMECVVVDPGCSNRKEQGELAETIESHGLKVVKLLNTHCHIDHVLGNQFVKNKYGVKLYTHKLEEQTLNAVPMYAPMWGFPGYVHSKIDEYLEAGDKVHFGESHLNTLFVPGHSVGHIAFYSPENGFCASGDVLFNRSIGRTDLPGGNFQQLLDSILTQLFVLPGETKIYSGHGLPTTIAEEKKYNPFCAVEN